MVFGESKATPVVATLYVNGRFADSNTYEIDGEVYYELRLLGQSIGFVNEYDADSGVIDIVTNKANESNNKNEDEPLDLIAVKPSTNTFKINGTKKSVRAYLINDYNYVNITDFAQAIGAEIAHDVGANTYGLKILSAENDIRPEPTPVTASAATTPIAIAPTVAITPPATPTGAYSQYWKEVTYEEAQRRYNQRAEGGVIIFYSSADPIHAQYIETIKQAAENARLTVYAVDRSVALNANFSGEVFAHIYETGAEIYPLLYVTHETYLDMYGVLSEKEATALFSGLAAEVSQVSSGTEAYATIASSYKAQVFDLVNVERQKNGMSLLAKDAMLSEAAQFKCTDMIQRNYYDHISPTYGEPYGLMDMFNITYRIWGENIAAGQATPKEVVDAWMASPGHKENILREEFTHVGVGYSRSETYGTLWSLEFVGR
jgi:uncharacterized YkwD family protein